MEPAWRDAFFGPNKVPVKVDLTRRNADGQVWARGVTTSTNAFGVVQEVVAELFVDESMITIAAVPSLSECVLMISNTDNGMGVAVLRASEWNAAESVLVFHSDMVNESALQSALDVHYPGKPRIMVKHAALSTDYHDGQALEEADKVLFMERMRFLPGTRSWFKPDGRIRVHRCDIFRSREGKPFPVDECGGGEWRVPEPKDEDELATSEWKSELFPVAVRLFYDVDARLLAVAVRAKWKDIREPSKSDKMISITLGGTTLTGTLKDLERESLVFLPSDLNAEGDRSDESKAHPAMKFATAKGPRTLIRVYVDKLNGLNWPDGSSLGVQIDGSLVELSLALGKTAVVRGSGFKITAVGARKILQGIVVEMDPDSMRNLRNSKMPANEMIH